MRQYSWETCPKPVRRQIEALSQELRTILGDNLTGLYLHGSLSMGCFNPERSDVDILAVTGAPIPVETKRRIVELLLGTSRAPTPIEISFLTHEQLHPWRYPPPFDLHFSESWRQQYEEDLRTGAWRSWNDDVRTDLDLAAHITHLRDRGIRLYGAPIQGTFPEVPREDYLAAILSDFREARAEIAQNPLYGVLNLCRVYRYLTEGRLTSKDEAGEWAIGMLPEDAAEAVKVALALYRGDSDPLDFSPASLERFLGAIDEGMGPHARFPSNEETDYSSRPVGSNGGREKVKRTRRGRKTSA